MGYVLGIDLGTTYSAVAVHRDGRAQIVSIGSRTAAVPSVVYLRQDDAILTGEAAERRAITEPARVAREFKRRLGDTTPIMVGSTPYSAEQLSAELLKTIVGQVVALEGSRPEHIAVCHPANWGPYKKDLLRQAVELAGLAGNSEAVTFLSEPEAAAIHYASTEHLQAGELLAVYDLGGGTFDAAVLRKTATGFETLGDPQGIERLGGIDFDAAVFNHVRMQLSGAIERLDANDSAAVAAAARLRDDCIEAKEALSSDSETSIPVLLPNVMTEIRLTRSEFEDMIRPALAQTVGALDRAVRSAGVEASELSRVLLVGGSSRIPLVSQMVSSALARPVVADAHPKHAIALGAAIAAAATAGGLDTSVAADATVLVDVAEEASLTRSAAAAAAVTGVAALPHPAAAGWEPDPTGRHHHRYFDGTAWTDDVADAGVASRDSLAEAVASASLAGSSSGTAPQAGPGAPPPPAGYRSPAAGATGRRRPNRAVLAAVAVVVLAVAGGTVALVANDSPDSGTGVGNFSKAIPAGGTFIHEVKATGNQVLLVKALPRGELDPIVSLAADFQTIDKFKTKFNGTFSPPGLGPQDRTDFSQLSDVTMTDLDGGLFVVGGTGTPGEPKTMAMPMPLEADIDIVVSLDTPSGTGSTSPEAPAGTVDLQVRLVSFPEPVGITDGGVAYGGMVDAAFEDFVDGQQDIEAVPDVDVSDIVADSDFPLLSDAFTDFATDPSDAFG